MEYDRYKDPDATCKKCHDMETIICDYCYCPLYYEDCGGNFKIMEAGIKDCSDCIFPHTIEFFAFMAKRKKEKNERQKSQSPT